MSIKEDLKSRITKRDIVRIKAVQEILNQIEFITEEDFAEIIEKATFTGQFAPNLAKYYDSFKDTIVKQKIVPIVKFEKRPWPGSPGFPLGIPAPDIIHLYFDNQVFAVNAIQIRLLEKDIGVKLQTANTIKA
ncbi:MAG: hypothetical protein FWD52_09265 [Candidatus Bathyarchaeota archaeon]|nr:hypothetical protein [Candidatus Termiticorpusculum sp.]